MARINLKGELISDEWAGVYESFGYTDGYFSPNIVRRAISELEEGEALEMEINSVGGLVDSAAEIYSLIQTAKANGHPTTAYIQSVAASAASYMALGCDRVEIALPAQMMIHNSSCGAWGNKQAHKKAANALNVTDQAILDVYSAKCGEKCTRERIEKLMNAETWLRATECVEMGLCDGIIGMDAVPVDSVGITASLTSGIVRAVSTLPDITDLLERRQNEWKTTALTELNHERRDKYVSATGLQ